MPASFIQISTESHLNKISTHTSPSNNTGENNIFINKISLIKNNNISLDGISFISSPLRIMSVFFEKIKCQLLDQKPTQTPVDIELGRVLSQGRILSDQADVLHSLLNNKPDIPPPSLSLTTKTGVVLGGVLLTSAIAGGGIYYFQRTGREQHHDVPLNKTNSDGLSSMSLSPYSLHNPFNTQSLINPYHNLSETRDTLFDNRKKFNNKTDKKSAKSYRKMPQRNNGYKTPLCPPIDGKQKTKVLTSFYVYTTKQPEICLTDSFNEDCHRAHKEARSKKGCLYLPMNMVLKRPDISCLCPPPIWFDIKVIEPPLSNSKAINQKNRPSTVMPITTTHSTILIPKSTNITLPVILPDNDGMIKNRTANYLKMIEPLAIKDINQKKDIPSTVIPITTINSTILTPNNTNHYEHRLAPKTNHTILPTLSDTEKPEEVEKVSTLDCYYERENITKPKIARIISNTIYRPFSTLFNEGRVIIQYNVLQQGCLDNTQFYETSKKVESVIEIFLSFLTKNETAQKLNRLRFATRFIAGLLELYADLAEGKKANVNTISDIYSELLSLSKDAVSSILTKDIERISKSPDEEEIKDITKTLKYQNNDLMINTSHDGKKIKIQRELNHFYDPDSKGFIFYDHQKKWYVDNDIESNNYIRKTFQRATEVWKDTDNIFFYKNSTPELYGYNIIIKYNNDIYALIDNNFYPIDEIPVTDTIFRYIIKDTIRLPITRGKNGWVLEDPDSSLLDLKLPLFIGSNKNIKNNLVSKYTSHQDVSPLSLDGKIPFYENRNEYLKINNEYFLIKKYQDTSYYIEGSHDTLALQIIDNKYHIKESFFDDLCCFHKEPLSKLPGVDQEGNFFLDNTVISHIKSEHFLSNNRNIMTQKDVIEIDFLPSPHIDGAIANSGNDYLYYDNMFIHIHSNDDNTYTLGDINDNKNNILMYKNTESKVYFKIPKSRNKWQGLTEKKDFCIVKRQPLSICTAPYFETSVVNYLVNNHINEGIIINNHAEQLEPYDGFRGIYKARGEDRTNLYYYTGTDDIFLYARTPPDTSSYIVPVVFTLYGKNSRQQINLNSIISNISIVKDFHTKKIIICTPEEAQVYLFDIKRKEFTLHLEWQGLDQIHPEITALDLEIIQSRIPLLNDLSSLDELFNRSGKKIITAPEKIYPTVQASINSLLHPSASLINSLKINSLKDIMDSNVPFVIKDICNQAFKKVIYNINEAIATMKHSSRSVKNYITHTLKISDTRARDRFFVSLERQLETMKMIFDEGHKEHIMIISKIRQNDINTEFLSDKGKTTLGFNLSHDPLDRIYINTAMMSDFSEKSRLFYINMISDTMIHEAVHALGKTEDYVYLPISTDGHISEISTSIAEIEESIAWRYTESMNLEYLSRLYFLNHPLYNKFSISSLAKASNLLNIFRNDPYYRSIILLNNPDTIGVTIRELAQFAPDQ